MLYKKLLVDIKQSGISGPYKAGTDIEITPDLTINYIGTGGGGSISPADKQQIETNKNDIVQLKQEDVQINQNIQTNTTRINELANGLQQKANDNNVVHLNGNETITGEKTFNTNTKFGNPSGMNLKIVPEGGGIRFTPSQDSKWFYFGSPTDNKYFAGIDLNSRVKLMGVMDPTENLQVSNKQYVDTQLRNYVPTPNPQIETNKQDIIQIRQELQSESGIVAQNQADINTLKQKDTQIENDINTNIKSKLPQIETNKNNIQAQETRLGLVEAKATTNASDIQTLKPKVDKNKQLIDEVINDLKLATFINYKGQWTRPKTAKLGELYSYNGKLYICKVATTNNEPTNTQDWDLISSADINLQDYVSKLELQTQLSNYVQSSTFEPIKNKVNSNEQTIITNTASIGANTQTIANHTNEIQALQTKDTQLEQLIATKANDSEVLKKSGGRQTSTSDTQFNSFVTIYKNNQGLTMKSEGNEPTFIGFNKGTSRKGYVGLATSSNNNMSIKAESGNLSLEASGNVEVTRPLVLGNSLTARNNVEFGSRIRGGYGGGDLKITPEDNSTKVLKFGGEPNNRSSRFDLNLENQSRLLGVKTPTQNDEAANKSYVDDKFTPLDGRITNNTNSINSKANDNEVVKLSGNQTIAGIKTFNDVVKGQTPLTNEDLTTKAYVDSKTIVPTSDAPSSASPWLSEEVKTGAMFMGKHVYTVYVKVGDINSNNQIAADGLIKTLQAGNYFLGVGNGVIKRSNGQIHNINAVNNAPDQHASIIYQNGNEIKWYFNPSMTLSQFFKRPFYAQIFFTKNS